MTAGFPHSMPRKPGFGGEFLEIEAIDRFGFLSVRKTEQKTRAGEPQVTGFRNFPQGLPGVLDQRMEVLGVLVESVGADRGDESRRRARADFREPPE